MLRNVNRVLCFTSARPRPFDSQPPCHPSPGPPAGVKHAAPTSAKAPVKIQVEPSADGISHAEGNRRSPERALVKANRGIVNRNIDELRLNGIDRDVIAIDENFLLLRRFEISHVARHGRSRCTAAETSAD